MWTRCFGTFALCTLAAGCHLASNGVSNVTYEAKLATAECVERCQYEKLAKASWESVRSTDNHDAFPKEYVQGFKDGFVDYLMFGGTGQPPYVPPRRFWGPRYRTPEGYQSIQDWFAGFRHGAAMAQQSGHRRWATVPTSHTAEPHPPLIPAGPGPADVQVVPSGDLPLPKALP